MNKNLFISLLRQGKTGNEILSILDTIVEMSMETEQKQPTLELIEF